MPEKIDVLCAGHAAYDLIFCVDHHPAADEKSFASSLVSGGGGPACSASVAAARLGCKAAFAGYLGKDFHGEKQFRQLNEEGVITDYIVRGDSPTPLSVILVKSDGARSVINYKGDTRILNRDSIDFGGCRPEVILFDGHEPLLSEKLLGIAQKQSIPTVLDAGSVHPGTRALIRKVDYVVASQRFAADYTGESREEPALKKLGAECSCVVITLGKKGLVWKKAGETGHLPAFPVNAVDTTGAGDAFHGAFAAGLVMGKEWNDLHTFASAAGALCCTGYGGSLSMPRLQEVNEFMQRHC
jgi:sulfofructose kinase